MMVSESSCDLSAQWKLVNSVNHQLYEELSFHDYDKNHVILMFLLYASSYQNTIIYKSYLKHILSTMDKENMKFFEPFQLLDWFGL